MKVKGLDGKEYKINFANYLKSRGMSNLANKAKTTLQEIYPLTSILSEVYLPGCGSTLLVDFFIPSQNLMIEVDGKQHEEYNSFHYDNKMDFILAQKRDRKKEEWAELNDICLIRLKYNETEDEWREKIFNRQRPSEGI